MESAEIGQVEQEIARLVSSVFVHLDECDRQITKRFGLTTTQYWALIHLEDPQGRSLSELAALLSCDKSNVTGVVDRLEGANLAERKPGKAGDRRYTRVVLTEKGQELRLHVKAVREQVISTRLRPLGIASLQQLYETLQQFDTLLGVQFASGELSTLIEHVAYCSDMKPATGCQIS
ncbi:MAG TPA: MarR family transcriptional regulator [Ktedonobacteraceae bacterium]|jgi:DNA-binding MarR family transcriptional regulator|nr:MarR family transcriptional regulator [Ktedonobacteraceae bacterium]